MALESKKVVNDTLIVFFGVTSLKSVNETASFGVCMVNKFIFAVEFWFSSVDICNVPNH